MDSKQRPLRFRPHHFLCTVGYEGKGYSPEFVANYDLIARELKQEANGDERLIEVTAGTADSICEPCPNRRGEGCATDEKIQALDRAHQKVLGLSPGERLTWGQAKARIQDRFTLEAFHRDCAPCAWKEFGICETALRKLRNEPNPAKLGLWWVALLLLSSLPAKASYDLVPWSTLDSLPKARAQAYRKLESSLQDSGTSKKIPKLNGIPADLQDIKRLIEVESPVTSPRAKRSLIWQALEEAPESPWTRRALESLPGAEISEAMTLLRKNLRSLPALSLLERATLRILRRADSGSSATSLPPKTLSHFTPEVLGAFAKRCELAAKSAENGTLPSCVWALGKLNEKFSSRAPEAQAIELGFPKLKELARPSPLDLPAGRLTQPTKSIEPDLLAADEAIQRYLDRRTQDEGLTKLRQFQTDFPRSPQRNRVRFWLLHAAEREGRDEEAKKLRATLLQENTYGWYGILLSTAPETGVWSAPSLELKSLKIRRDDPQLSPHERRALRRAQEAEATGPPRSLALS